MGSRIMPTDKLPKSLDREVSIDIWILIYIFGDSDRIDSWSGELRNIVKAHEIHAHYDFGNATYNFFLKSTDEILANELLLHVIPDNHDAFVNGLIYKLKAVYDRASDMSFIRAIFTRAISMSPKS